MEEYKPSLKLKTLLLNTCNRIITAIETDRYITAEQTTELLFRQLMQINDHDAMKDKTEWKGDEHAST